MRSSKEKRHESGVGGFEFIDVGNASGNQSREHVAARLVGLKSPYGVSDLGVRKDKPAAARSESPSLKLGSDGLRITQSVLHLQNRIVLWVRPAWVDLGRGVDENQTQEQLRSNRGSRAAIPGPDGQNDLGAIVVESEWFSNADIRFEPRAMCGVKLLIGDIGLPNHRAPLLVSHTRVIDDGEKRHDFNGTFVFESLVLALVGAVVTFYGARLVRG